MSLAKSATIEGIIDQHGTRWVILETALGTCSLSMTEVVEPSKAAPKLAEIGIVLPPGKSRSDFFARISAIAKYDGVHVVDQTGWHRHVFAIGDGGQVVPSGAAPLPSMMRAEPRAWTTQGSLKAWKNKVAKPLTGQRIPMFVIALAFAPAIIRFLPVWTNPGFELVGTRGTGKSTALQLASSVYGGIGDGDGRRYWATWNTTVAGMETLLDGHTNCLLPLDELNAFSGGARPIVRSTSATPSGPAAMTPWVINMRPPVCWRRSWSLSARMRSRFSADIENLLFGHESSRSGGMPERWGGTDCEVG